MQHINKTLFLTLSIQLVSCSASFMKATPRSKTTALVDLTTTVDAAGNVTAAFDPNSSSVQVLRLTSGTLKGAGVALPPGALSIPVSITVGEGETLASSSFNQELGLSGNSFTAAGPSVSFIPSQNVEANSPFTLSIPLSPSSGLHLASSSLENLIVLYRWMDLEGETVTYKMGLIPKDEVTISDSKVSFQTTKFGVFQIAVSETKITEPVSVKSAEPPALKADAGNPLVGTWGVCYKDDHQSSVEDTGGGSTDQGPPDWTAGNTVPTGTCPTFEIQLNTQVTGTAPASGFMIGISIAGSAPTTDNSQPVLTTGSVVKIYDNQSATSSANKIHTLWAPPGCYFLTSGGTASNFFKITTITDNGTVSPGQAQCTSMNSDTTIYCDASTSHGGWTSPTGGGETGGGETGGGEGSHYDGLGQVKDTTYSNYDYVKFTSNTYLHVKKTYKSDNCSGTLVSSITDVGKYELPAVDVVDTLPVNFTTSSTVATIFDADAVKSANDNPDEFGCSLSTWIIGVEKDISNTDCSHSKNTEYSRIKIIGNKFHFCDSMSGDSETNYGASEATRVPNCANYDPDEYMERE